MGRGCELSGIRISSLPRRALLLVALAALAPAAYCDSNDRIQYFVDDQGVVHLSNVPADPRYKPLGAGAPVGSPQAAVRSAPPTVVPPGSMLNEVPQLLPQQEDSVDSDGAAEPEGPVEADNPADQQPTSAGQGRGLWGRK